MNNKNIEMMKKIIEEKKKQGLQKSPNLRGDNNNMINKSLSKKGFNNKKHGGAFDK